MIAFGDSGILVAAIRGGAQHIVTDNLADFPADVLAKYDIEALGVLRTLREVYSNPPFTPSEFVRDLTAKELPLLAARTEENQDEIEGRA